MNWIDAKIKPQEGSKIICDSAVGFWWGIYSLTGWVEVEGSNHNWVEWEKVYRYILYPSDDAEEVDNNATDFLDFCFLWERGIDGLWRNRKSNKGITTPELYKLFNNKRVG